MKPSVDVRNDVYNWFRVLFLLDSIPSFGNPNDQFHVFDQKSKTSLARYHPLFRLGIFDLEHCSLQYTYKKSEAYLLFQKILVNFSNCHFEVIKSERLGLKKPQGEFSTYESKYFGLDRSVWAENMQGTLFLYEEPEKSGPESICWFPRFQYGCFFTDIDSLNHIIVHIIDYSNVKSKYALF